MPQCEKYYQVNFQFTTKPCNVVKAKSQHTFLQDTSHIEQLWTVLLIYRDPASPLCAGTSVIIRK